MTEKPTDLHSLAEKIDKLLVRADGTEPHIFDPGEVKDIQRILLFFKRLDDGEFRDLHRVLSFVQRLDALGW